MLEVNKIHMQFALCHARRQSVEREIKVHSRLRHPGIVKLHSSFEDTEGIYLVMDLSAGDLCKVMRARGGKLGEEAVIDLISGLLAALEYCHSKVSERMTSYNDLDHLPCVLLNLAMRIAMLTHLLRQWGLNMFRYPTHVLPVTCPSFPFQGITHCDIKPENILLRHEEGRRVLLTGFGLASEQSRSTCRSGNLDYMVRA